MSGQQWRRVPIGLDADRWVTRPNCKAVLAVVHTVTSAQRLLEAVRLIEPDLRVQMVYTTAPDVFGDGAAEFLDGLGALRVPWEQATRQRFDLALAASLGAIHELHAPLVVMPHGAGFTKLVRRPGLRAIGGAVSRGTAGPAADGGSVVYGTDGSAADGGSRVYGVDGSGIEGWPRAYGLDGSGIDGGSVVYGLDPQRLMHDGVVVPAAIVLPHEADLGTLGRSCPQAVPAANVVGDPSFDRLKASLPHRDAYRRALAVGPGHTLVVVTSTWGTASLFGRRSELLSRLVAELPSCRFRVVGLLHPNVWSGHGSRQVRTWLADGLRQGLGLVPPDADWRGVVAAADVIIGDHGSATVYGTVAGVPVMLAEFFDAAVDPTSAAGRLATVAPRLSLDRPLREQLATAEEYTRDGRYDGVVARITSEPGHFDRNMRRLMYRLLGLRQPAAITAPPPAAVPYLLGRWPWQVRDPWDGRPPGERPSGCAHCADRPGGGAARLVDADATARWWTRGRRRA
ncbi:hypothetical protein ABZT47_01080 [Sphaerisporangium sp. NPDC005289]|uniref:hypothetical protein n=1 Tax=Sphaerisporangium sp. NPDC005289 TaxID=3155247 RepID=UPI0033A7CABE